MLGYPYGWLAAAGLFFLCAIVVLLSPVVISGRFIRIQENDDLELRVKALFGLIRMQWKLPDIRLGSSEIEYERIRKSEGLASSQVRDARMELDRQKVKKSIERYQLMLRQIHNLTGWTLRLLSKVRLVEWKWHTAVGTGDAMWTALATGSIWTIQSSVIGFLSHIVRLQTKPSMEVQPDYSRAHFSTQWSCIAKISFGYAILAGLQLVFRLKNVKGGVIVWQNIRSKA
ncbi:hypothetical protein IJ21_23210 [Paenibacillus sp. 32O-W]|jgi:Protein of unknown function (DUF2953).|uniref:DUF2953 domain-containing protein n=1 Tax=Paenibacillus cisolokensis TaxID=1658519 RepID=A0ABQ4N0Q5_9BACL|nr:MULTISPECIES: DUF2953 domain-containing protein [Paenibacillus]ALS27718.1 hypothetical protein IJ21_23210 [Paenibacillus sp. 32O-W]GIQ61698.1 hypothetical protein PACILC2_02660 [Paenibacillus cisolokensis]